MIHKTFSFANSPIGVAAEVRAQRLGRVPGGLRPQKHLLPLIETIAIECALAHHAENIFR
jgi:hypothetical protein